MRNSEHYLFYTPTSPSDDGTITLDPAESHHALTVLRLQPGDNIQITNGKGSIHYCTVKDIDKKQLYAQISESRFFKRPYSIHLMIGLPEKDPFETAITECTALGVSRITPIVASHCQKPWWKQSWDKSRKRFTLKMSVSMKQSLFPWLPILDEALTIEKSLSLCTGPILVADFEGTSVISLGQDTLCKDIAVFIGPPGGFSAEELELLMKHNAMKVKIGEPRFRTELASVVICSQLIGLNLMHSCQA
ncbi:MAG: 16S rRNA (uracil(1498)-N(3))-methyltransferase [Chitinispirillaceae bacterium]|nr:16S rRNA (uracil(1498)-N(3))-methyltransferase [Chitinispirillaceae bacterium]